METPKGADSNVGVSSLVGVVSPHETKMSKDISVSSPSQLSSQNGLCGKMISIIPVNNSSVLQSKRLSPGRAPPLPCTGGFRLQPRKNISNFTSQCPSTPSSLTPGRGRKRGANEASSIALKSLLQRRNESNEADSPILVHHAMQSMSIRSPTPSSSSLQDKVMQDKESQSPFLVFSPSLKPSPYRQRPRSESFCSIESSTKPPSSVVTVPNRVTTMYGSPRRIAAKGNYNHSNNVGELPSTPRSHCYMSNSSQAPATPVSIRTLPSPFNTPLPRSIKLTPRSSRQRDDSSNEASIFLSPNEKFDHPLARKESTSVFTFEGGMGCLEGARQRSEVRTSSYVPSPFSCSRTSITSRTAQTTSSSVGESRGGSLQVDTRSLLGPQDSTSTLDYIISTNARIAAQDCDGSLSDNSDEPFVLANPAILDQERNAITMPPPRPSRRRKMSLASSTTNMNDNETSTNELGSDMNPSSVTRICCAADNFDPNSDCDKKFNPSIDLPRYSHKYSTRLKPIESYCSLVGLGLTESSSSIIDFNPEPSTPLTKLGDFTDSTPPGTLSKTSVCISRSDADNVHLTIANMAVLHQEKSPTLTACSS